jgi:hypothetical protein
MLLFDRREKNHVINWMVARHPHYVKGMQSIEPKNLNDGLPSTAAFKNANTLIANMQIGGPLRSEFPNFQYDHKQDLYHCHVTMGSNSYDVIWDVHEDLRLIFVLDIAPRENFDYVRSENKENSKQNALKKLLACPNYQKIFAVPNMVINPALEKMYKPFFSGQSFAPIPPKDPIVNMTVAEVKAAQEEAKRNRAHHRRASV